MFPKGKIALFSTIIEILYELLYCDCKWLRRDKNRKNER